MQEKLCLWNGRALFLGALPDLAYHEQAAALLCVGLEDDFVLTDLKGSTVHCRSALIAPQTQHALNLRGNTGAFLFFDPDNGDYEYLLRSNAAHSNASITTTLKEEPALIGAFTGILGADSEILLAAALNNLEHKIRLKEDTQSPDERVQKVMRRLIQSAEESIPIEVLAEGVGLSPSRLAHLFKDQVGVPIRMFRTWFRLKSAVLHLKEGASLTDAALKAGFYDSAHFANTFRETFGISPSVVFGTQRQIQWYVG